MFRDVGLARLTGPAPNLTVCKQGKAPQLAVFSCVLKVRKQIVKA
jgi:hypothetical protein